MDTPFDFKKQEEDDYAKIAARHAQEYAAEIARTTADTITTEQADELQERANRGETLTPEEVYQLDGYNARAYWESLHDTVADSQ